MTELDGTLTELARLRSAGEPIVSLYLDVRWADEQQRERVRLFVQERVRQTLAHYPPGTPDRPALDRTLQRVQAHVARLTSQAEEPEKHGLALFACEGRSLWRPMSFRRPFTPELCTDAIPHLVQLARLADDFEPAIVVVPDQAGTDVYEVRLGDLAAEASLRGLVPRRERDGSNPGAGRPGQRLERQEKDARRQEALVRKHRRAAAEEVQLRLARTPGAHLVLVGTAANVAAIERELPERLRARVIARLPRPREWESADGARRDGVVAGAAEAVAEHERAAERRVVEALVGEALRGGLGVVGPEDVVQAVNEGRVHRLVLEEDFQRAGWQCDRCAALGASRGADLCPYCGGDLHTVQQLGEALVARALAGGAQVEVVAHANRLHGYRGVGAFLRQTAPTGLRGASPPWPTAPGASQP